MSRIIFASLIGMAMIVWLLSGQISSKGHADGEGIEPSSVMPGENDEAEQLPHVRAVNSIAEMHVTYLEVRGQTRANRTVAVKSEISGKVEAVPGEKGKRVETGDTLCKIAVDARAHELSEARSALESANLEYEGALDLKGRGLHSAIDVARAKSALESAKVRLRRAELALQNTQIKAPFSGVIESQPVEVGDFLTPDGICVTIIEMDPILVTGEVAEKNVGEIEVGEIVDIELITGVRLRGILSFIGRSPERATRTYPVEVVVDNPGRNIRTGLTASMKVPMHEGLAHLISPASLVLNDQGTIGVRIVDDQNTVRFRAVKVVSEAPEGVWIKGLPDQAKIITVGQEDVYAGQVVRVDLSPLGSAVSAN